ALGFRFAIDGLLHLCRFYLPLFAPSFRANQPISHLYFLPRFLRLVPSDIVNIDPLTIGLDVGCNDMDMGVCSIRMTVDQVRLFPKPDPGHVIGGNSLELFVGKLFADIKVQGDVDSIGAHLLIQSGDLAEAVKLVREGQSLWITTKPTGGNALRYTFAHLVLVVAEQSPYVLSADHFCNHCLASAEILLRSISTWSPTLLYCSGTFRAWNK